MRSIVLTSLLISFVALSADDPAIRIVAVDGVEVQIDRCHINTALYGPLNLTEVEIVASNAADKNLVCQFIYRLDPQATVVRFGAGINGKIVDGILVNRSQVEDLLEKAFAPEKELGRSNQDFVARGIVIPAKNSISIKLSYFQTHAMISGERKLVFPLTGLKEISDFAFDATVPEIPGEEVSSFSLTPGADAKALKGHPLSFAFAHFTPKEDVVLSIKANSEDSGLRTVVSGSHRMYLYRTAGASDAHPERNWEFFFDNSTASEKSKSAHNAFQHALLTGVIGRIKRGHEIEVWAFDKQCRQATASVPVSPIPNPFSRLEMYLGQQCTVDSADITAGLKALGQLARSLADWRRFVLIVDGSAANIPPADELIAALGEWPDDLNLPSHPKRHSLSIIVFGQTDAANRLRDLARKCSGYLITIKNDLNESELSKAAVSALATVDTTASIDIDLKLNGDFTLVPSSLFGLAPGSEAVAFAEIPHDQVSSIAITEPDGSQRAPGIPTKDYGMIDAGDFGPLVELGYCCATLNQTISKGHRLHDEAIAQSISAQLLWNSTVFILPAGPDRERLKNAATPAQLLSIANHSVHLVNRNILTSDTDEIKDLQTIFATRQ